MNLLKNIGKEKNLTSSQREKDKLHKRNKSENNTRLLMRSHRSQRTVKQELKCAT